MQTFRRQINLMLHQMLHQPENAACALFIKKQQTPQSSLFLGTVRGFNF